MISLSGNQLNSNGYWSEPVAKLLYHPTHEDVALFDQNGYDLTPIEQLFAHGNYVKPKKHRDHIRAIKEDWLIQSHAVDGAVLNHSLLFERKAYTGEALAELKIWAKDLPLLYKIIALRPKWGLDFSMDYVDRSGNAFEILHWEFDSFDYQEAADQKIYTEEKLIKIDWNEAGKSILKCKDQWHHLNFFEQSDWKCNYFGIPKERFKMVAWA
jgi:hypothetical protein